MIQLPLVGAFLEAAGVILEKRILKSRLVDYKNYTVYSFLAIVVLMLPALYFFWDVEGAALEQKNVLIFVFVILSSVLANLFIFYSLKREKVVEFEPLWLMQPFFVVVLAFILFESERDVYAAGLALVAGLSLIVSHIKRHHLQFDRYTVTALLGSFFFAVELVVSRFILEYYSSFSFYFIRCFFIFAVTLAVFRPSFNSIKTSKMTLMILATSLIWVLYRVIVYYGYLNLGIIFTTTIFMFSPVLMFLFAVIFLNEKPTLRQAISTFLIFICVVLAVYLSASR